MSNHHHQKCVRPRSFPIAIIRERLKQTIAANCRSDHPARTMGMTMLATAVGVYTNPKTIEADLWAYVEQVETPVLVRELHTWCRSVAKDHIIPGLPQSLPQFQLELV